MNNGKNKNNSGTISTNNNNYVDELSNIVVRSAREHNLKNVDIDIPRDKFVVITGLSGSGKSSLAFDTLYAEGQRRYLECLSVYAKQFLGMLKKPDVDSIEGLSPAISIEQKSISHNPRSTVGTVTEIYDYLRLLFSKIGVQHCVDCNIPVKIKSLDEIVDDIMIRHNGRRIQILAPLIHGRKGHYKELFERLQRQGFTKVRVDGELKEIKAGMQLSRYKIHNIELVVDRCLVEQNQERRISESSGLSLKIAEENIIILYEDINSRWKEELYSTKYSCPSCGRAYQELAPNMFSYNSPYGACPNCQGLGVIKDFDLSLVIPDKSISIAKGGILPLGKERDMWLWHQVSAFSKKHNIDISLPIEEVNFEKIKNLLYGSGNENLTVSYQFSYGGRTAYHHKFIGILPSLKHHYENTSSGVIRKNLENYMIAIDCPECKGGRLKTENLNVLVANRNIHVVVKYDINKSKEFFADLHNHLSKREQKIADIIIKEIISRLKFLDEVGLSYLTLDRGVRTLSGGESQRIRLASQIGSELVGILYVLDEPSIGLHQHDNNKLIKSLKRLRDLGNSVIIVEHDKAMIEQSDHVIDIGPGAGVHGGKIILSEAPDKMYALPKDILDSSLTAQYLNGMRKIKIPEKRRKGNGKRLILTGAKGNNLRNLRLELPLGLTICITGMSGSGKSTLINDTLYPILARHFYRSNKMPLAYSKISGMEHIDKVIEINQSPIGRTPRSNPATYTGLFTLVREFFCMLTESKIRGYKAGRFSFNVKGGRCEDCEGGGIKKIEMNFLPDVYVICDVCKGKRYNRETLEVKYKDKSIADVLAMTVEEAVDFFNEIPKIKKKLKTLFEVGLGYITLGQQAPTLSGGEAQRVKLAKELSKLNTGKTLYLLDEPTTGLHFEDIRVLLKLLDKLVDKGNTVIIIEHNLDVIKYADWIIDLGPKGGFGGGKIIAQGTPEEIIKKSKSYTGRYLKKELEE